MSKIYMPPSVEQTVPLQYRPQKVGVELIIFRSLDPEADPDNWEIVQPNDVPAWLKEFRIVKQLSEGYLAQKEHLDKHWYRAERVPPPAEAH